MEVIMFRMAVLLWLCTVGMVISVPAASPEDAYFKTLPAGCFVNRSVELSNDQVTAIGRKLGAAVKRGSNNYLTVQGYAIRVNILEGKNEADAKAIYQAIASTKSNPVFCLRNGNRVVEYVGKDPSLAIKTSYELSFTAKPKENVVSRYGRRGDGR